MPQNDVQIERINDTMRREIIQAIRKAIKEGLSLEGAYETASRAVGPTVDAAKAQWTAEHEAEREEERAHTA